MKRKIIYSRHAEKDFRKLEKPIAKRIAHKIVFFANQENFSAYCKKLTNTPFYRFRIGDYRVIFALTKDGTIEVLNILRIMHRKEIYDSL